MKKTHRHLYAPSAKTVSVVTVPPMNYLMIDGEGNPNASQRYVAAVQALYKLAYGVRAVCKAAGQPFTVMPLEGLWWFRDKPVIDFVVTEADKDRFIWTLMIVMPDFVSAENVAQARATAQTKKPPVLLGEVRFERFDEGEVAQILHIGSYADEGPNVARIHHYIEENGWTLSGKHHEIYLGDPRRVAPQKLKTIIRQPFTR